MIPKAVVIRTPSWGAIAVLTIKRLEHQLSRESACKLIKENLHYVWHPEEVQEVTVYYDESHWWYKVMAWADFNLLGCQCEGPGDCGHHTPIADWVLDHYKVQVVITKVLDWLDRPDFDK
jgi:hypothetical protein